MKLITALLSDIVSSCPGQGSATSEVNQIMTFSYPDGVCWDHSIYRQRHFTDS